MGGKGTNGFQLYIILTSKKDVRWYFDGTFYSLIHRKGEVINLCDELKCSL